MRSLKVLLLAVASLLLIPVAASAEPVQLFSFQVKDIKPGGRFTLVFSARTFDTTGAVPPNPIDNYLRIPAGAVVRREFLTRRFFCDGPLLRDSLNEDLAHSNIPFTKRVADLRRFIRMLGRQRSRRARRQYANAVACERGRIGVGTANVDARATRGLEILDRLIPSTFAMFLSRPTEPGALFGFTVVGAANEDSPITRKYPIVAAVHVALAANFFNEPSADGLYGYRLQLPVGNIAGLVFSIAELQVITRGLTILRGECLKTNARGRCVRRQRRTLFWFSTPPCPASGFYSIQNFFDYADPLPDITKTFQLTCPRFLP